MMWKHWWQKSSGVWAENMPLEICVSPLSITIFKSPSLKWTWQSLISYNCENLLRHLCPVSISQLWLCWLGKYFDTLNVRFSSSCEGGYYLNLQKKWNIIIIVATIGPIEKPVLNLKSVPSRIKFWTTKMLRSLLRGSLQQRDFVYALQCCHMRVMVCKKIAIWLFVQQFGSNSIEKIKTLHYPQEGLLMQRAFRCHDSFSSGLN